MATPLWCWRCRRTVPMLDEDELAVVSDAHREGVLAIQAYRRRHGVGLDDTPVAALHRPVRDAYRALTGETGVAADEILNHRVSRLGPPCRSCGKPLRSPRARLCAQCGTAA